VCQREASLQSLGLLLEQFIIHSQLADLLLEPTDLLVSNVSFAGLAFECQLAGGKELFTSQRQRRGDYAPLSTQQFQILASQQTKH